MRVLFLHGWTSVPGGVKPTYLKNACHEVINPSLPDDDFDESVRIAEAEYNGHRPDVIVGSSRGGAVATRDSFIRPVLTGGLNADIMSLSRPMPNRTEAN